MASEQTMAAPSKVAPPLDSEDNSSIASMIYRFFKKVSVVGAIYLVGYLRWSVAWLAAPLALSLLRDQWRRESEARRSLAKMAARSSERDVVLARLDDLPAWVFFPDVERAEWLNRILLQLWPNVNHFARGLLQEHIAPAVAAALQEYKLTGFRFERMILGTIAPRVGGVKVYDKTARDEIILDVDLFYAGDCDISFALSGIRGGIKDLQVHGALRLVLRPLLRALPLVGALHVFFLNRPHIDFNLVGAADVLDMPGLSDLLRRVIVDQVAAMMVLPNKLPIKLSDDVPTVDLRMPEPEGVLRIHVVQAENLMSKDISLIGKGKSDPYAVVSVGAAQWRTKHISSDLNPRWDYWCEAAVGFPRGQRLQCELWDRDAGPASDDFLGRCSLDISQVVKVGRLDTWQTLQQAKHGKVRLILSWHRLSSNVDDLKHALLETQVIRSGDLSAAVLSVYIDSCDHLPNARAAAKPDPYVKLTVGRRSETSGVTLRTDRPVLQLGYCFLVRHPELDSLQLEVLDQKTGSALGSLTYPLESLLRQRDLTLALQPMLLQRSGPDASVTLSAQLRILREAVPAEDAEQADETDVASPDPAPAPTAPAAPPAAPPATHNGDGAEGAAPEAGEAGDGGDDASQRSVPLEHIVNAAEAPLESQSPKPESPKLVHRASSFTMSAGAAGLGRILLSLRYSMQNQVLYVVVHKIANIPLKDPSSVPDPYVKLYLLPGRARDSKRRTAVVKDSCMPEYDEQFEWALPLAELHSRQLEVSVATHKGFGTSPVIGQVIVYLNKYDFREARTLWFDLLPEAPRE